MKKFFPLIFLVLLILSDAFLKEYVHYGRLLSLALFLISSFYFLLYLRDNVAWESFFALEEQPQRRIGIVVLIILAGAFFRFWKLTSLFDGVFWDEAYKGLDALAMREFGEHPIFLDWNAGREALVAYLVACSTTLSGYTTFAVRAVEALAGTITLVFFYLFLREIFAHKIAILGLILLAVSKYHIIYSRFGIRVNLILLFEVATLYFLARGIKSRGKGYASFLMAGVSAGLGFYTYIAYRIFPLVGLAFLVDKAKRHELRKRVPQIATGALVCFLIVAPLGLYFFKNARSFSDRMSRTALWANKKEPLAVLLLKSTRDTIGIFTYRGDMNARHNVASEPGLSPFSSAFFWLGMILLLAKLRKPHALFLFAYFVFMITPGILGADAPHASRNLGALPPAIVLTSIGIFGAAEILRQLSKTMAAVLLMLFLGGNILTGLNDALFRYSANLDSQNPAQSSLWGMNSAETDVAGYLDRFGDSYDIYLTPQLYFHATIEYLAHSPHNLFTLDTSLPPQKIKMIVLQETRRNLWWLRDDDGKNFFKWWQQYYRLPVRDIRRLIVKTYISYPRMTNQSDERLLKQLLLKYPNGKLLRFGQFTVYLVPAGTASP